MICLDSDEEDAAVIEVSSHQDDSAPDWKRTANATRRIEAPRKAAVKSVLPPASQPAAQAPPPKRVRSPKKKNAGVPVCIDLDSEVGHGQSLRPLVADAIPAKSVQIETTLHSSKPGERPSVPEKAAADLSENVTAAVKTNVPLVIASAPAKPMAIAGKLDTQTSNLAAKSAGVPPCVSTGAETDRGTPAKATGAAAAPLGTCAPSEAIRLSVDAADNELEKQALSMAEKALEKLPPAGKAEKVLKAKEGILKRLKQQAVEQKAAEQRAAEQRDAEERAAEQRAAEENAARAAAEALQTQRDIEARQAKQSQSSASSILLGGGAAKSQANLLIPKGVAPKSQARAAVSRALGKGKDTTFRGQQNGSDDTPEIDPESHRKLERQKRKAIWGRIVENIEPDADGKLTANGWEKSEFDSTEQKGKFLRLMGGQKFVDAVSSACGDGESGDDDIPTDLPTFELCSGEWVQDLEGDDDGAVKEGIANQKERAKELEKVYCQAMKRKLQIGRSGLGAG